MSLVHNISKVHQDAFNEQWLVEETLVPGPSSTGSTHQLAPQHLLFATLSDYMDAN